MRTLTLPRVVILTLTLAAVFPVSQLCAQVPMGTAFTYQGRLLVSLAPPNSPHDFRFRLFTNVATGNVIAGPVTNSAVLVSNGLFTTKIDFGPDPFDGESHFWKLQRAERAPVRSP